MVTWEWLSFAALSKQQLYEILSLRQEVFIIEQQCNYRDADDKDQIALHLLGYQGQQLVAYLRLFEPTCFENKKASFGRVACVLAARHQGLGKQLVMQALSYLQQNHPGVPVMISAQAYLQKFYENLGFEICGEIYLDVGIPHINMVKDYILPSTQ